ncbi:MAG: hypothetical protein H6R15_3275 [Proteobacteria bacterium]|nr:hypothetical protein [Pseudomonadota bacterium]
MRKAFLLSILIVGLLAPGLSGASSAIIEKQDLIGSDFSGQLSDDQLQRLTDEAQAMVDKVVELWSADSGVQRFGKIRVVFDSPHREIYSSVSYRESKDGAPRRVVGIFGIRETPQMMAHKLTSAIFPQPDKLIRNMMGISTEVRIGNPLSFPSCGFSSDDWVSAFIKASSYLPLADLSAEHEPWGMRYTGGGKFVIFDKAKQHKAYAEAGSFGNYLVTTHGFDSLKRFHRLAHVNERPWLDVFGKNLKELEADWLMSLRSKPSNDIVLLSKLIERSPATACAEAQRLSGK